MCWGGQCMGCMEVEKGTMIVAVITAVLWAKVFFACMIGLIVANTPGPTYDDGCISSQFVWINVGVTLLMVLSMIHFIFAVILCNGIHKRNVTLIKAFLIYGAVKMVFESSLQIFLMTLNPMTGFLIFFLVLYGLFLHMVNMTYKKFNAAAGAAAAGEIDSPKPLHLHSV